MDRQLPVAVVCRVLGAPRSTMDARRRSTAPARPGPAASIGDHDLVQLLRLLLRAWPVAGEGDRKVRAGLRREHGIRVSGNGSCGCCADRGCWRPSGSAGAARHDPMTARSSRRRPTSAGARMRPWPGPAATGGCGCSPAWTTPPLKAWAHVAKVGDRFAALQPVSDAVIDRWGRLTPTSPGAWICGTTGARWGLRSA
jgi:putative transposase